MIRRHRRTIEILIAAVVAPAALVAAPVSPGASRPHRSVCHVAKAREHAGHRRARARRAARCKAAGRRPTVHLVAGAPVFAPPSLGPAQAVDGPHTDSPAAEPLPPVPDPSPAGPAPSTPPVASSPPVPTPGQIFSPTGPWNAEVSADAPLDPSSPQIVAGLNAEIQAAYESRAHLPTINTTAGSIPIYTVPADQPTVRVTLMEGGAPSLQAAWDAVPLPPAAHPSTGSDRHLVVWQPNTEKLWEFWGLGESAGAWYASWGGAIEDVSSDPGVYGPEAWPGATSTWGASASSLSIAGGLITFADLESGQIDHALAMSVPTVRGGAYASPATRTDGTSASPLSLPEGAHLRLDPELDLGSLHLPPLTLEIAEAAQRYGIFVRDKAGNVVLYGQDPTPTGTNPYAGPGGFFEGAPPQLLLKSFPWSHLQLLAMELHGSH